MKEYQCEQRDKDLTHSDKKHMTSIYKCYMEITGHRIVMTVFEIQKRIPGKRNIHRIGKNMDE